MGEGGADGKLPPEPCRQGKGEAQGGAELALGPRLRALRRERGLSLGALADACGVSKSMLSKIERGDSLPTVGAAARMARALAVPLARLLGIEAPPAVEFRPAAYQESIADPRSGTTRYQLLAGGPAGLPRIERLVAPPGSGRLVLPAVVPRALLVVAVSHGRLGITCGEGEWSAGEGDCVAIRGPAAVAVQAPPGELAVAYLVSVPLVAPSD